MDLKTTFTKEQVSKDCKLYKVNYRDGFEIVLLRKENYRVKFQDSRVVTINEAEALVTNDLCKNKEVAKLLIEKIK